jgi:hypothetical protein
MPKYDHIHDREAMVDREAQPFRGDEHLRVSGRIGVDEPANNDFTHATFHLSGHQDVCEFRWDRGY